MANESTEAAPTPATLLGTAEAPPKPAAGEEKTDPAGESAKADPPKDEPAESKPDAAELELKLPDGMTPGPMLEAFKPLAKELGLDTGKAQKLVDLYVQQHQAALEAQRMQVEQEVKGWAESARKDPEMGGANFDASLKAGLKAIHRFGDQELKDILNTSGLGNHPALMRFAAKVGRAIAEDSIGGAVRSGAPANTEEAQLRKLYPSMFPDSAH